MTNEGNLVITGNGTINDLVVAATAKIGEKISLRRFEKVTKEDNDLLINALKDMKKRKDYPSCGVSCYAIYRCRCLHPW